MLSVIMLNVTYKALMLSVAMVIVVVLSAIVLSVVMLNVILMSVVASFNNHFATDYFLIKMELTITAKPRFRIFWPKNFWPTDIWPTIVF